MAKTKKEANTAPGDKVYLGPLADAIGFHLHRASAMSFANFSRRVGQADLPPAHYAILQLAKENPGISQIQLSRAVSRDKSTLTPALRNLEEAGLLMRVPSEKDKRANHVHLTPAGRQRLEQLAFHATAHDRLLAAIVGPARHAEFLAVLQDLIEQLSTTRDGDERAPT